MTGNVKATKGNVPEEVHILSLQEIEDAEDITEEIIPVPAWGGSVRIRSISQRTMKNLREKVSKQEEEQEGSGDIEKELFIEGMIEPKLSSEEYERLRDKSAMAHMTVLTAILKSSGMSGSGVVKIAEKAFRS